MKTIFHFNCVVCGAHPPERRIEDFDWPPTAERRAELVKVLGNIICNVEKGPLSDPLFRKAVADLRREMPAGGDPNLYRFEGSDTVFTVRCPLCGTEPGPRPLDTYFRPWFAWHSGGQAQVQNLFYEMSFLLAKVPEVRHLGLAFEAGARALGGGRCRCGRPGVSSGDLCRWCADAEEEGDGAKLDFSFSFDGEEDSETQQFSVSSGFGEEERVNGDGYMTFLRSLEGHDLLGGGVESWEAVRTGIMQDIAYKGRNGTSYLLMALTCHPVSSWLEPWRKLLESEGSTPGDWHDQTLFKPPPVPQGLERAWRSCRDLPIDVNEFLYYCPIKDISRNIANCLESRGLLTRGSPDDFSGFLETLPLSKVREISHQLGTGKGRSKAEIAAKIVAGASPNQITALVPEIKGFWVKELRSPFDGLPQEWVEYAASTVPLIERYVRRKYWNWQITQEDQTGEADWIVQFDTCCPSYCKFQERRIPRGIAVSPEAIPPWFPGCACSIRRADSDARRSDVYGEERFGGLTVGSKVVVVEEDDVIDIEPLGLFYSWALSQNGLYRLVFSEEGESGWWMLIKDDHVAAFGRMAYPSNGAVANNGTFVLSNRKPRSDSGTFWSIDKSGKTLVRHTYTGNTDVACISSEGGYAACVDSWMIILFDLNAGRQIARFNPADLDVEMLKIDEKERTVEVTTRSEETVEFDFNGALLDKDAWDAAWAQGAMGYDLINRVQDDLDHELSPEDEKRCLKFLTLALHKGVSTFSQGVAYEMMARIHEKAGRLKEAVKMYETALERNSGLTIKRHLKELKARIANGE